MAFVRIEMRKTISHEDTNENLTKMIGENLTPDGSLLTSLFLSFASHECHHKRALLHLIFVATLDVCTDTSSVKTTFSVYKAYNSYFFKRSNA